MILGAQLYTVRDFCQDTDTFAETLKKVADIGYTTVQVSGTCEFKPEWLKAELDKNGLKCVLTHTAADKLTADPVKVAKDHDVFNCEYVGLGAFSFCGDNAPTPADFVKQYKPVAQALKENGKYFMYHNHAQEFGKRNGKLIIDTMIEEFSPDEMGFTLDTFWVQAGGADPAQWIEKLSGRLPVIHLKDYAYGNEWLNAQKYAPIGEGNINFDRIFEKAQSAGTKYIVVEQDDCYGENPFDCLKRSYDYLHSLGFK